MKQPEISVCFIFNSSANAGKAQSYRETIRAKARKRWPGCRWIETTGNNSFWDDLRLRAAEIDLLVACGGDGTVHRVGNIAADQECTVGVIPIGSGNDFALMHGIPASIPAAFEILAGNIRKGIDLIHCSGDLECWCLNSVGVGFDGLANTHTQALKKTLGRAGYLAAGLKAIVSAEPFTAVVETDDAEKESAPLMMLTASTGCREGGQFIIARKKGAVSGQMNLLKIKTMSMASMMLTFPQFFFRVPEYLDTVELSSCKKVALALDRPVYLHVDGEYPGKKVKQLMLEIYRKKIRLMAPSA